ncbi:ImmA/IrrE family metallo-endopeptidase [Clostridium scatologenes]|nr:ImmA/IrrE family metallo-endopeptidase [Clostridium scatologenes]
MINIRVRVNHLVKKYGTRDPEKLAKELSIIIKKVPFKSQKTKGFFKKQFGKKFIVINSNLSEFLQKIVLAHELGHATLHVSKSSYYIHEFTLFPRGKYENAANKFAAEILINENDIDTYSLKTMSINELSCYFGVPERLIMYKFFE